MDEMLKKQDVLDAIYAKMEKTDKPDVILGLAAAMSTVKQMQAAHVKPAEKEEPCEDAISRQAVLNLAKFDGRDGLGSIIHAFDVEQLPSVTPAEKVGHWIDHQEDRWIYAKCSECETVHDSRTNYCPYCGAKMQEVEE